MRYHSTSFLTVFLWFFAATSFAQKNIAPYPKILDESALNERLSPCEDFYQFACGGFLDNTEIPADKQSVSRQVTPMADQVDIKLNDILAKYSREDYSLPASASVLLGQYYLSCINTDQKANVKNAEQTVGFLLKKISTLKSAKDLAALVAELKLYGISAFFNFAAMQDYRDSSKVIGDLYQGGMSLDDPEYYLSNEDQYPKDREEFLKYITKLIQKHSSWSFSQLKFVAKKAADDAYQMELNLAKKAYSITDQSNPEKVIHPAKISDLSKLAPHFDWSSFFTNLGIKDDLDINIDEPEFIENFNSLLQTTSLKQIKHYLSWLVLNRSAKFLGSKMSDVHFQFWNVYMNGAKSKAPNWKQCTHEVGNTLGYALAEAYVQSVQGAPLKAKAHEMIVQIKDAFASELNLITTGPDAWLDANTQQGALAKLSTVSEKLGSMEKFRDYSSVFADQKNHLLSSLMVSKFESLRDLARVGKLVDKSQWDMMPWEVNAYYDRSNNEFVFPYGILMPPSLDLTASDGANMGAFGGGTIGHELTHGFDNNGSQYDAHGNVKNWWSPETLAQFKKRSQCYIDQANQYVIHDVNLAVDGEQTLEENLADQGGVKLGYVALNKVLQTRPEAEAWLGRYNEHQQYWIAYAQSWCTKMRPEALRSQMTVDVHPPAEFRVNQVLRNMTGFAADFKCQAGQKMAPVNRCSIW